jgi:hypothetical protein
MRFSRRTLGALARVLDRLFSHQGLDLLFFEFSLDDSDPKTHDPNASKNSRLVAFLRALEHRCLESGNDDQILELLETSIRDHPQAWPEERNSLKAALKLDGFEWANDKLLATTPEPAALAPQVSALEAALRDRGFSVANSHYGQAVDNFTSGNWESANAQVRPFLENLFIALCKIQCGKEFSDANAALQHLKDKGNLDLGEWNNFRHFWNDIQDNGPHHGLSAEHEALYRLHVATATARYLLDKLK